MQLDDTLIIVVVFAVVILMVIAAYRRRIKAGVKALGAELDVEAEGRSEPPVSSAPPTAGAAFGHDANAMSERLSHGGRSRTLVDARFSDM
jgi:hypothetical protein